MDNAEVNLQDLALRVRVVEKQTRRWKFLSFLALLLLGFSIAAGVRAQGDLQPNLIRAKSIEAQGFALKDFSGSVRAALRMKGDRPVLELYDSAGRVVWSTPEKSGAVPLS